MAIKRIRPDLTFDPDRRRRFLREAQAAAALQHPAIVQVFDLMESDEGDSLVMEYVEGCTLAEMLSQGRLRVAEGLQLVQQILDGLARAHERGLVHRDLKSENVMVTPEGEAKILDFGLAKRLDAREIDDSLTREGAVLGTIRAMSPEQAAGREVDSRTDLYSLGVLLFEMLTGRPPFEGANALRVHHKILTAPAPPPRALRPELPKALSDLVETLLDKDPARRPQTSSEVLAALDRIRRIDSVAELGPPQPTAPQLLASSEPTKAARQPTAAGSVAPAVLKGRGPMAMSVAGISVAGILFVAAAATVLLTRLAPSALAPAAFDSRSGESAAKQTEQSERDGADDQSIVEIYRDAWSKLEHFDRPGHVDSAIDDFRRVVASGSMQAAAYAGLSRALLRKYDSGSLDAALLEQAEATARQAVALESDLAAARVSLAWSLIRQGLLVEARTELDEAAQLAPGDPGALLARAELELKEQAPDATHAALDELLDTGFDSGELRNLRGSVFHRQARYDEAADEFRRAIELAPDSAYGYRNLSSSYFMLGRYAEASAELQNAIALRPTASLYSNLGTLYFYRGLYSKAAEALEKAVDFPSGANSYLYWANLGDAYRFLPDRGSEAKDAYLQAIRLLQRLENAKDSLSPQQHSRLCLYLAKSGRIDEALDALARVAETDDRSPEMLYREAVVFELAGRRDEALVALNGSLRSGYPISAVEGDPELLDLRSDARFHRLALATADSETAAADRTGEPSGSQTSSSKLES